VAALAAFEHGEWGQRFPPLVAAWRRAWSRVIPFFAFPPEIGRIIDTTNALESVHAQLRTIIKTRGHFPNRRGRNEIDLAGAAKHPRPMGTGDALLARGHESIRHSLRRSRSSTNELKCRCAWTLPSLWTHTKRLGKPHSPQFPTAPTRIVI
jgi:transposase-like protein